MNEFRTETAKAVRKGDSNVRSRVTVKKVPPVERVGYVARQRMRAALSSRTGGSSLGGSVAESADRQSKGGKDAAKVEYRQGPKRKSEQMAKKMRPKRSGRGGKETQGLNKETP